MRKRKGATTTAGKKPTEPSGGKLTRLSADKPASRCFSANLSLPPSLAPQRPWRDNHTTMKCRILLPTSADSDHQEFQSAANQDKEGFP